MTGPDLDSRVAGPARPGFTLDLGRCVGCGSCVLACRIENRLPKGVSWRRVLQVNRPRIGGGPSYHLSVACHHCQNPPCAGACPSGALEKRPNGLVHLETGRCIGCRYCEMACPFGAPSFDEAAGVMTKCNLCRDRLEEGSAPACVGACPTGALGFSPPVPEEGKPLESKGKDRAFGPAVDVPGFGDPAEADPGFWVADPTGAIRSRWFRELKALLGIGREGPHDPV